eukprot:scaffold61129_cov70-Phaeocystis_antarctica.AAC.6
MSANLSSRIKIVRCSPALPRAAAAGAPAAGRGTRTRSRGRGWPRRTRARAGQPASTTTGSGFGQLALSRGCFQSQSMPQNNSSSGQPRPIRRLGHADRPHRPWFRPRERPRGPGTRAARAQWCRSRRVGRAASKARTPPRRTRPRTW